MAGDLASSADRAAEIQTLLSVSQRSVEGWTKDARQSEKAELQDKAWDLWLDCHEQQAIATELGVSEATISGWFRNRKSAESEPPESRQHFDVWNFPPARDETAGSSSDRAAPLRIRARIRGTQECSVMGDTPMADHERAGVPNLMDMIPAWQADAACKGAGVDLFFSERQEGKDNHCVAAKRLCSRCQVLGPCLDDSLARNEATGIWGGCGEQDRRGFRRLRAARTHGPEPQTGCSCGWCREMRAHLARLAVLVLPVSERPAWTDRPAPASRVTSAMTHARRSTFSKGCRCGGCRWAASRVGQAMARLGQDTASQWARWVPGGLDGVDAVQAATDAGLDLIGEVLAGLLVLAGHDRRREVVAVVDKRRVKLADSQATLRQLRGASGDSGDIGDTMSDMERPSCPPQLLTAAEVAARFRVDRRTVQRMAATGLLPVVRVGERGVLRFRLEDVEAAEQSQRRAA